MELKQEIFNIDTEVRATVRENGKIVRSTNYGPNTIVNNGRRSILDRLINAGNTNEGILVYGAVGTGSDAVTVNNTSLTTELARATLVTSFSRRSLQTTTVRVFFAAGEATGDLTEFGWYGGGVDGDPTASADSGTLYTRILIEETVTANQTITIEQDFTW